MVIASISPKGGSGKSTTALNLAVGLRQRSKRVLAIDIDRQGALHHFADTHPRIQFETPPPHFMPQLIERVAPCYTVIDCSQYLEQGGNQALRIADVAVVPVVLRMLDLNAFMNELEEYEAAKYKNPKLRLIYLINQYVGSQSADRKYLQNKLNGSVSSAIIPFQRTVFEDAAKAGKSVVEHSPDSKAAQQYQKLIEEIIS